MKLFFTVLFLSFFTCSSLLPQELELNTREKLNEHILYAHPGPANNGGSPNWAIFFNLTAGDHFVDITHMTVANNAAIGASFEIEFFTRHGNALGGPVSAGPGSSSEGWISRGIVPVTQGEVTNGISLLFSTPVISVDPGQTVGVAMKFISAGPRYVSSTSYLVYSDNNLTLETGDSRSIPFTTTGSWFGPRPFVGEIHYDTTTVPVELISFTSNIVGSGNSVELNWATATEINNAGFSVERKSGKTDWEPAAYINGHGTTTETNYYSFTDNNLNQGLYYYRLKQIDYNGEFKYYYLTEAIEIILNSFRLSQNYPNPFNPDTKISFQLITENHTTLKVYDHLGKEVATLLNENLNPGIHEIKFDASALASGTYFYRIVSGNFSDTRKMIFLK
jgi:hypothetical protein